jgi:hypothetical protein
MSKHVLGFIAGFLFVCLCGVLVGLAGGVQWGTMNCGFLTGMTLGIAAAGGMGVVAAIEGAP